MIDPVSALRTLAIGGADATSTQSVRGAAMAGADFGSVLAEVAAQGVQTLRSGEAAALGGLQGKASVQQVVEAVMSAEQTLQAAIAIRDKVVGAYQEISRMAI